MIARCRYVRTSLLAAACLLGFASSIDGANSLFAFCGMTEKTSSRTCSRGFAVRYPSRSATRTTALFSFAPKGDDGGNGGDFPIEEETSYEGSVDWDAEWKKVVANRDQPIERPGKEFYKTEAEIAAIRAAKKAASQAQKISDQMPSLPSWKSLQSDWKVS